MSKKSIVTTLCIFCAVSGLSAYNPPLGGENMFFLTSPLLMTGGASAAGGPLMDTPPETIMVNPALTGGDQRIALNAYTTVLSSFGYGSAGYGQTFQLGATIPSKWGVFTVLTQGVFSTLTDMAIGNTFVVRGGFAKDISDTFYVGAAIDAGGGNSWMLNLNLGVWQNLGSFGFLKDLRWGASMTGMGKPLNGISNGINGSPADFYPSFFTPRLGIAGTLVSTSVAKLGLSLDFAAPAFQNGIFSAGLSLRFIDMIYINSGWSANIRELLETGGGVYPSVSISVRFEISGKKDSFLEKQGWQKSDIIPEVAYQRFYGGINALSAGAVLYLGVKDTEAPVIRIGGDK